MYHNNNTKLRGVKSAMNNDTPKKQKEVLYANIGKRLRKIRLTKGLTQEKMAELLEFSTAYYGKIERGVYGMSLHKLFILNEKLDVDITYLLTGKFNSKIELNDMLKKYSVNKRNRLERVIEEIFDLASEEGD